MYCGTCDEWCEWHEFSNNQWRKGDGVGSCRSCVEDAFQEVQCDKCDRWFDCENSLNMHMESHLYPCKECGRKFTAEHSLTQHMKTHRPKTVSCPVCGVTKFASAANAVAHVESGYCSGCRGKDNARSQIYNFISHKAPELRTRLIEGPSGSGSSVPDRPYQCTYCGKTFTQLSAQMNHEGDVHGSDRRMRQLGW
ncbi:unnamed protein product [Ectocarpus fasciculatus]